MVGRTPPILKRDEIVAKARQNGIDDERVRDLFHLLLLPPQMRNFPIFLNHLDRLIILMQRKWPRELQISDLAWLPDLVSRLRSL
jgi:hypothetical protein